MNILISNIGRRGYLVDFLKADRCFDGKVFVSDCDETASGLYGAADQYFVLSRPVDNPEIYIDNLLSLCEKKRVDIVIPVIDPEIPILAKAKERFAEKGIMVLVSNQEVVEICNSKKMMNRFLIENGFELIQTYDTIESFEEARAKSKIDFPVFIKEDFGSASLGAGVVKSMEELRFRFNDGMIIQENVQGEEYGVDIFNDWQLKPVRIVIKKKPAMRSGETDKAITVYDDSILYLSIRLGKTLKHFGPLDCDILKKGEQMFIIDLNPRFGGGYPASHLAGANLLGLLSKLKLNQPIEIDYKAYRDGVLTMKDIGLKSVKVHHA